MSSRSPADGDGADAATEPSGLSAPHPHKLHGTTPTTTQASAPFRSLRQKVNALQRSIVSGERTVADLQAQVSSQEVVLASLKNSNDVCEALLAELTETGTKHEQLKEENKAMCLKLTHLQETELMPTMLDNRNRLAAAAAALDSLPATDGAPGKIVCGENDDAGQTSSTSQSEHMRGLAVRLCDEIADVEKHIRTLRQEKERVGKEMKGIVETISCLQGSVDAIEGIADASIDSKIALTDEKLPIKMNERKSVNQSYEDTCAKVNDTQAECEKLTQQLSTTHEQIKHGREFLHQANILHHSIRNNMECYNNDQANLKQLQMATAEITRQHSEVTEKIKSLEMGSHETVRESAVVHAHIDKENNNYIAVTDLFLQIRTLQSKTADADQKIKSARWRLATMARESMDNEIRLMEVKCEELNREVALQKKAIEEKKNEISTYTAQNHSLDSKILKLKEQLSQGKKNIAAKQLVMKQKQFTLQQLNQTTAKAHDHRTKGYQSGFIKESLASNHSPTSQRIIPKVNKRKQQHGASQASDLTKRDAKQDAKQSHLRHRIISSSQSGIVRSKGIPKMHADGMNIENIPTPPPGDLSRTQSAGMAMTMATLKLHDTETPANTHSVHETQCKRHPITVRSMKKNKRRSFSATGLRRPREAVTSKAVTNNESNKRKDQTMKRAAIPAHKTNKATPSSSDWLFDDNSIFGDF